MSETCLNLFTRNSGAISRILNGAVIRCEGAFATRKFNGIILAIVLVLALVPAPGRAAEGPTEITIIHDSHVHGNFATGKLTIAQKAQVINEIRARKPGALFVGNGDDLGTSVLSNEFRGSHVVDAFNKMGMVVDGVGNHDFDMGPENFLARVRESQFTWVTANLRDARTGQAFGREAGVREFIIALVDGLQVGFTSLGPANLRESTSPGPDVQAWGYAEAMRDVLPRMRAAGADVVVVLSHICGPEAEALAAQVPGIDAIVGDHCAQALEQPKVVGNTIISRVGDKYRYVGELTLQVAGGRVVGHRFTRHEISEQTPADPAIDTLMKDYNTRLAVSLNQVIGRTAVTLDARKAANRLHETLLGDFVADVTRQSVGADIGLINGGNVRAERYYFPGPLSRKDVIDMLPFTNYIVKLEVSGAAVLAALENGVSQIELGAGRFPQVSGVTFHLDTMQPAGSRVSNVKVGGKALDPAATYTLATNSFMAGGGDGFGMLEGARVLIDANSAPMLTTAIIDAIATAGTIAPQPEGRIVPVAGVNLTVDQPALHVGPAVASLDVAPGYHYETVFTPLRAVVELYGGEVEWLPALYAAWVKMPWGTTLWVMAGTDGYLQNDRLVVPPSILHRLGINTDVGRWAIDLSL